ncbi:MAG TPA: hypothetical protein VGH19_02905 [Verrucomicrobiae bacterium]
MLKPEDIEIQIGRGQGGDFMFVIHKPTGIRRSAGPPLPKPGKVSRELLAEIEAEIVEKGLMLYGLPNPKN